ncbi:unnamed protein product [Phytomonas sp. EM1]|nr:unnamed protein product [Phytomonas sp. EM1]|eukprot:CCW62978.1 unnamed protein product [Phytomonas sp. isolate EM1]
MPYLSTHSGSDPLVKDFFRKSRGGHSSHAKELVMISMLSNNALKCIYHSIPYVTALFDYLTAVYDLAYRHDLTLLLPMVFGLILCFFGGQYLMLVTISETVRLFCWRELVASANALYRNYEIAMESSRRDDLIDADGNRIPDVKEISRQDLLVQKLKVFMKTVDVIEVRSAIRTLATAYFSIIAALRLKVARYLALALSSARVISKSIPLERILAEHLPPGSKKWSGILADTQLNVLCMILALFFGRWVCSLNCAIQGSSMFVQSMIMLGQKKGLLEDDLHVNDPRSKALVVVVAATGFLWQASHRSGLPFPFNVFLFPLTLLEWCLQLVFSGLLFLTPSMDFQ